MSYHGKLQTLKNGTADAEIQLWAYQQLEKEPAELTDEEIEKFEHLIAKAFDFSTQIKVVGLDRIIKAILRKAQDERK